MQTTNTKLPNVKQTLTSREGNKVVYVAHVGPNRAQRRRSQFGRAEIAERRASTLKTVRMFLTAFGKLGKLAAG